MTKEQQTLLTQAVAQDFPGYSEISVSFPDKWELVREIRASDTPLYIAALPHQEERARAGHFPELGKDINQALTNYRFYKCFQPWPQPRLLVSFPESGAPGRVIGQEGLTIQLKEVGQAQAWHGGGWGLIWECYYLPSHRERPTVINELTAFWQSIEGDIEATTFFTEANEPDFPEGELDYTDFLTIMGYSPLTASPRWWSKTIKEH